MPKKKEKPIYNKVLGVDIGGATRMGVCLFDNTSDNILTYSSILRVKAKTNLEHRLNLIKEIQKIYEEFGFDILIFESIRLFSFGRIQLPTILSLNKVQTTVINEFSDKFPIYQIDVRSWKASVLGTAKAQKDDTVLFVQKQFPDVNLLDEIVKPKKKEIVFDINHDLADAVCIAQLVKYNGKLEDKNLMNYK